MKLFATFILSYFAFALGANAQPSPSDVLAIAAKQNIIAADLPQAAQETYAAYRAIAADIRVEALEGAIAEILLTDEAKLRRTSVENLLKLEVIRRVPNPPEADIKAVYDANKANLGSETYAQVKPRIIAFLRQEPEAKALDDLVQRLKKKHKVTPGVDPSSPNIKDTDVIAAVNTKKILGGWFLEKVKPLIFEETMRAYLKVSASLEETIYNRLIFAEAASLGIQPENLIANEIFGKMQEQTDAERERLRVLLQDRLFTKYTVKVLFDAPSQPVQKISIDDDPAKGSATAPVTIVMFSDFECSACAAAHPVVEELMKEFAGKVRLVVRDFPLAQIHPNAIKAAEAANAARAQGKFFEYIDILYKNQKALDTVSLKKYAAQLGLNGAKFNAELTRGAHLAEVRKDYEDGVFYGIKGTPTFFINGVRLLGYPTAENLRNAIQRALPPQ